MSKIGAKKAAKIAVEYAADMFGDHGEHFRLEELEMDRHRETWAVTVGFSRPGRHEILGIPMAAPRSYKVVRVNSRDGEVLGVRNGPLKDQD